MPKHTSSENESGYDDGPRSRAGQSSAAQLAAAPDRLELWYSSREPLRRRVIANALDGRRPTLPS